MLRIHYAVGFSYVGLCAAALTWSMRTPTPAPPDTPFPSDALPVGGEAADWFAVVKPFCNALEAERAVAQYPPPPGLDGRGFAATCFALAGNVPRARGLLLEVDPGQRWRAAGIVFDIAHPVADAGDDRSAGPIMELVVEFWPNHYMALYHAGAAAFALGQRESARQHLEDFRRSYAVDDGWRAAALRMLDALGSP